MVKSNKKPKKRGRPKGSFLDNEKVQKILYVLRNDGTEQDAYLTARVPKATFFDWKKKNAIFLDKIVAKNNDGTNTYKEVERGFADAIEEAKPTLIMTARIAVAKGIQNGNTKLAMQVLSKRDDRYKDKPSQVPIDPDKPVIQVFIPDNKRTSGQKQDKK